MKLRLVISVSLCVFATSALAGTAPADNSAVRDSIPSKSLIRVDSASPQAMTALKAALRSWDLAGTAHGGRFLDIVVTERERAALLDAEVPFETLIEDIEQAQAGTRATYPSFTQLEADLAAIATNHPNITQLTSIGQSWEGRDIWCLEISDNPGLDEGEVGVLYMGLHHAREWPSLAVAFDIADRLTSQYNLNPDIRDLVDERRIWVIPCVNPDGYVWDHDEGHDWRKNRHPYPGGIGVDLNRNYGGSTDGAKEGEWGSIGQGSQSHQPSGSTYLGPLPFSEPETQAIRDFLNPRDVTIAISYHTHGELVLWPWSYSADATVADNTLITWIGQGMAAQIGGQSGGTYTPQQGVILYPTSGSSDDWIYGYRYYELGRNTLSYTVEIAETYHPSEPQLQQILDENWDGARYVLEQAASAESQMVPFVLPPNLTTPAADADGDFTVSWTQANPDAGAESYELQELTGLTKVTENADAGTDLWNMELFETSSARSHSGFWSFKSPPGNEVIAALTTMDPLPVAPGEELTFWTWYDLETEWDMAFVEVSIDGLQYDVLDTFTGSSGEWVQQTYGLAAYEGRSIYLRFRYTSDSFTTEEGFYVDDIHPVPSWANTTILSSNITETSYAITGREDGDYYYRVRGASPQRGFGQYCDLAMTRVEAGVADLNGDGSVDAADLALLLGAWGACPEPPADCSADLNLDGGVDAADLALLLGAWG